MWRSCTLFMLIVCQLHVSIQLKCSTKRVERYQIVTSKRSWPDARQYCQGLGRADLVVIQDQEELDYVRNMVSESNFIGFWIGLSDAQEEGTWKWLDHDEVGVEHDAPSWSLALNEPNGGVNENCALLYHTDDIRTRGSRIRTLAREYIDIPCNGSEQFICEFNKCYQGQFSIENGHRLQNHLLNPAVKVKRLTTCTTTCLHHRRCRSVNLIPVVNETNNYWCEINVSTKGASLGSEYVENSDGIYAEVL